MKISVLVSLAAMALVTEACDQYKYGWCTNTDGTANNDKTKAACREPGHYGTYYRDFDQCYRFKEPEAWWWNTGMNNCDWNKQCKHEGAARGFCETKVKSNWFKRSVKRGVELLRGRTTTSGTEEEEEQEYEVPFRNGVTPVLDEPFPPFNWTRRVGHN